MPDHLGRSVASRAEEINEWAERLRRAEGRISAVENDLRFYRSERRVASETLARLRIEQLRDLGASRA